jgi:hypothetical protein
MNISTRLTRDDGQVPAQIALQPHAPGGIPSERSETETELLKQMPSDGINKTLDFEVAVKIARDLKVFPKEKMTDAPLPWQYLDDLISLENNSFGNGSLG